MTASTRVVVSYAVFATAYIVVRLIGHLFIVEPDIWQTLVVMTATIFAVRAADMVAPPWK